MEVNVDRCSCLIVNAAVILLTTIGAVPIDILGAAGQSLVGQ